MLSSTRIMINWRIKSSSRANNLASVDNSIQIKLSPIYGVLRGKLGSTGSSAKASSF